MTDCSHPFAPCAGECTSPTQRRAAEINARQRASMAEINWLQIVGASVASALITAVLLFCVAAVVERGAENIRQTQIQNERV